jgi:murein DD-endopeptidase MepM/ murein hydrolase activator NlpD
MKSLFTPRLSVLLSVWMIFALASCGGGDQSSQMPTRTRRNHTKTDSIPFVNPTKVGDSYVKHCPVATEFQYPVGKPVGKNGLDTTAYFKARGFLGAAHLGDDWNRNVGGNRDMGDFVYAAGDGVVFFSGDYGIGWGEVVRMLHNIGTREKPVYIETVYAHLNSAYVRPGNVMKKGDAIGTVGNANGKYHAHLHFETRLDPGKDISAGLNGDTIGFVDPTLFIETHNGKQKNRP